MTDNWKNELRLKLEDLLDRLIVDGVSRDDACNAVIEAISRLKSAHETDPDPAEDVAVEEPANDWPAAGQARPLE
ncbi:hypothetical protein [Agrobacterium bohemicum]|uniref:Uncharacterized protein n=1 Tax=Agrobacterium bohemicum TaxID=2052828 RepID=A0A135P7R3_9HYPH|nr:hypothetical protein [Agrobacterium bohemicum]KXG87462.1 hypothetical protein ATO67_19340 [Agrobacterium bohemicum]